MGIKVNTDKKEFTKKLWTGIAKVQVKMINPTVKEFQENGLNFTKEPVYTGEDRCRIDIWTWNETMGHICNTFWLNTPKISQNNTWQFIDKYGRTQYADKIENLKSTYEYNGSVRESIDVSSARKAYKGEDNLVNFIINWANLNKDKDTGEKPECRLDTLDKIIKGDVTELKNLLSVVNTPVYINFGIRSSNGTNYQDFYPKAFDRGWTDLSKTMSNKEPSSNILRAMKKESSLKSYYGEYPYTFKEYIPVPKEQKEEALF